VCFFIMNSKINRRTRTSIDCSGHLKYDMHFPNNFNPNPMTYEQSILCDVEETGCKSKISQMDFWCRNVYEEDLDYLRGNYPLPYSEEFYNIDELLTWEQLMYQQRKLNRLKVSRQFKLLLQAEEDSTFMGQLIMKQHRLWQVLNGEENQNQSSYESNTGSVKSERLLVEDQEKDSWVHKYSMEQFSEQGSSLKSQVLSDSSKAAVQQEVQQKSRHCRHFLKGHCERGESCGFRHDRSVFCTDLQKVFLGGLPAHLTARLLRKKLAEQGYTVLNNPKIIRWFSPQVCLGSVWEAQRLVKKGTLIIDGKVIRVRPFEAITGDNKKKLPDEVERSVFLGGLPADTTAQMIHDDLAKIGLVVINIPLLMSGYTPQVTLQTFKQAHTLLKLKRVEINGSLVSVRPFANIRSSSKKKKNRNSV